jgi:predicted metallo-beta-lactamase superfamily hydrolase
MLKYIKVVPLAAESLGVRSMCTYVETPDIRILLDAGVSLCPVRFGLPPHPLEFKAIAESRRRIAETADKAKIVTISHYHFDHHTPSYEDWLSQWTVYKETARQIYEDKTVLIKNPKEKVNASQRRRGWLFQKTSGKYAEKLETADGKTFSFGKDTKVKFSEPVFHGPDNSALGWVLMATIEHQNERFMFASDVQGPLSTKTLETICREEPQLIIIGGPPLYLSGFKTDEKEILIGIGNLEKIVHLVPVTILEHHILRDENWREKAKNVFVTAKKVGHEVLTAAEFLGKENVLLEARRKRLFEEKPPSKDFVRWMKEDIETQKHVKPPI